MLTITLFMIYKNRNSPNIHLIHRRKNEQIAVFSYNGILINSTKKQTPMSESQNIMLCEGSITQKSIHCMISFITHYLEQAKHYSTGKTKTKTRASVNSLGSEVEIHWERT